MKAARETDPSQPKQEAAYNNEKDLADAWGQGHRVVGSAAIVGLVSSSFQSLQTF